MLQPPRRPSLRAYWVKRVTIWCFWLCVVLSVGVTFWALWYVNDRGFTSRWRRKVQEELARRGVYAEIGRLTLNPLRGVVAKEVKIRAKKSERAPTVATVSEVVLDLDYSKLVHGEQFVKAVDLINARLSLPLKPGKKKSARLEVEDLNARLLFPPYQLYVAQAEARVQGLRVTATGQLVNPQELYKAPSSDRKEASFAARANEILAFLDKVNMPREKPHLNIRFHGDAADPENVYAEAVLHASDFVINDYYPVKRASITASLNAGVIRLTQLSIEDKLGSLDATGIYRPRSGEVSYQLRSTLDLQGLVHGLELSEKAGEFVFYSTPSLESSGELTLRSKEDGGIEGKLLGHFETGRFGTKSIIFEGAGAEFSWNSGKWFIRDARLFHRSGNLSLSAMNVPGDFRFSIDSRVNPKALTPLLPAKVAHELSHWEFHTAPSFQVEGGGPSLDWKTLAFHGHIALGKSNFRGPGFESLTSSVTYKGGVLDFPDFTLKRKEGSGTGAFSFNFQREVATLTNVVSTMRPQDVAVWVDADGNLPRNLAPYRFRTPPHLLINGTVQIHDCSDNTRLRIDVDGKGLDYTFLGKELFFDKVDARLWIIQEWLSIEDLVSTSFGGSVKGDAKVRLTQGQDDFSGNLHVDGVDFASLTGLYLDYDTSKGKLQGDYSFSGVGMELKNLNGKGALAVSDGNVFDIPLFGPFSGILNSIIPGTGYNVARKASATFTMDKGTIETPDLLVEGKGFVMRGGGKLFPLDDKIDFSIRIHANGPAGVLLTPVSHLFEYVSDDSLSKPHWRPRRLPKAMFKQP